ncbi:MAG: transcriptional regulator [Alphaproteobacteria bacterium]|nr:transcriptional regulator [Alphaproteobacteria bacterium]
MTDEKRSRTLRGLTADIAASYIVGHPPATTQLPKVIEVVHAALAALGPASAAVDVPTAPAVPIKRSIADGHLICLGCGVALKTLKRHLRAAHALAPHQYREKWRLPLSYPMVAPSYARQRSHHAKAMGLGTPPAKN